MSDRNDIPSVNATNFTQRVRETLQTYLGRQGDPLDRGLTLRDLIENGILKLPDGFRLRLGGGSLPLLPGGSLPTGTGGPDAELDLTPPPTPTGFTATGGVSFFIAECANPNYLAGGGHLRSRLYGVTRAAGAPAPVFADAVEIAQFDGAVYAHATNPATTWHLWLKWETKAGVLSIAPAGGTNGVVVTTAQDVTTLLNALSGQIRESQLYSTLGARINLIDGPPTLVGSVAYRVYAEALDRISADNALGGSITTLQNTSATQASQLTALTTRTATAESSILTLQTTTSSQATSISGLSTRVGTAESSITNLQSTTSSQATSISGLSTRVGTAESNISSLQTTTSSQATLLSSISTTLGAKTSTFVQPSPPVSTSSYTLTLNDLWYDSDDGLKPYRWTGSAWADLTDTRLLSAGSSINSLQTTTASQATSISSLNTRTSTAESNISSLQTTTSNQASSLSSLTTRVGSAETSITNLQTTTSSQASSISTLNSTVSGQSTSIQTLQTTTNGLNAQYTVKIDNNGYVTGYGLASTATNGTPTSEFIVRADTFGIASPSGPGITPAEPFIVRTTATTINGVSVPAGVYITDAFIQNGTITNAKIANAAIDDAKIANLSAAKITAGTINAAQLDAGVITSKVLSVDWAKITGASISSAQIQDAAITSAKIASVIQSDNYSAGFSGWQISRAGTAEFNSITLRGKISAGSSLATRVEVGAGVGPNSDHHGISLSGSDYSNCFIRRQSDNAIFFNLNAGTANAMTFNSASGVLQVRGDVEATSIKANTIAVQTANIAGQAVVVPVVGSNSVFGLDFSAQRNLASATVSVSGLPSGATATLIVFSTSSIYPQDLSGTSFFLRIYVNGSLIAQEATSVFGNGQSHAVTGVASVGNGTHTIQITGQSDQYKILSVGNVVTGFVGKR